MEPMLADGASASPAARGRYPHDHDPAAFPGSAALDEAQI
jgi:hypothetical protein